jgi:hypothetical protein
MAEKDVFLAVLGSDIAVAGARACICGLPDNEGRFFRGKPIWRQVQLASGRRLVPIIASLGAAWMCVDALQGGEWEASHVLREARNGRGRNCSTRM